MGDRAVDVLVQIAGQDLPAGRLWAHRRRDTESQTFSYDDRYLALRDSYALDPLLRLVAGQQHTPVNRAIFGAFSDCSPDRWGRRLIGRAERRRAKREGGAERSFGEIDYLLGVRDDLRQGALRFRDPEGGELLAPPDAGVPSLLELPRLLGAAERLERDQETDEELAILLRGGSSLGGARPKAHVVDGAGGIAIAKFPSPSNDEWDVVRWEAVALELARRAAIRVPDFRLHVIDGKSVLIIDRFDRVGSRRLGYVSAMTMLERSDGDRGSYLEIADAVERNSPSTTDDLHELWRRIAFSVLISNLDDHLRNHGFLRTSTAGWSLSPAFDLNPDPRPGAKFLQTAIDFDDSAARIDLLMDTAPEFRLSASQAVNILREVHSAASAWRAVARDLEVTEEQLERLEPAFVHDAESDARTLLGL